MTGDLIGFVLQAAVELPFAIANASRNEENHKDRNPPARLLNDPEIAESVMAWAKNQKRNLNERD